MLPVTEVLLESALCRYLLIPPEISYPYRIILVDIDPDAIAGRVVVAGVPGGYQWQAAGGAFLVEYSEVQTVLTQATPAALLLAIAANFPANRQRTIRAIFGQTAEFLNGADFEYPCMQLTYQYSMVDWVSQLRSWAVGITLPKVQVVRAQVIRPPDSLGGVYTYINMANVANTTPFQ